MAIFNWDVWSILANSDSFHTLISIFFLLFSVLSILLLIFYVRYK